MKRVPGKPRTLWFAAFAILAFWRTDVAAAYAPCESASRVGGGMNDAEMRQRMVDLATQDWRVFGYLDLWSFEGRSDLAPLLRFTIPLARAPTAFMGGRPQCDVANTLLLEPILWGSARTWADLANRIAMRFPTLGS